LRTEKEVMSQGLNRPADVLIMRWQKGKHLAVNLAVVHPLQLASFPLTSAADGTVARTEKAKTQHDQESCSSVGWGYCPLVLSTWGSLGFQGVDLTSQIIKDVVQPMGAWEGAKLALGMKTNLSMALLKGVVSQLAFSRLIVLPLLRLSPPKTPSAPVFPTTTPFLDPAGNQLWIDHEGNVTDTQTPCVALTLVRAPQLA
jgi:hypothetical protein